MAKHNEIGAWGESLARDLLITKGYAIVGTNISIGKNELDIVAMKDDRIVFVEVKTRSDDFDDPLNALDTAKIRHLTRAADSYVRAYNIPQEIQFDVIVVIGTPEGEHTITHYADAFRAPIGGFI